MEKDIRTKNITVKDFLYLLYAGKKDANEVYNGYRRTKDLPPIKEEVKEPLYTNCDKFL